MQQDQDTLFDNQRPPRSVADLGRPDTHRLPAHVAQSETSRESAIRFIPCADTAGWRVLAQILLAGDHGRTDDEVEVLLEMRHQTASSRRVYLEGKGIVIKRLDERGRLVKRTTRSGRNAGVYIINPTVLPEVRQLASYRAR